MAYNPNTDFSSGAILTAAQQNRFPRGVMNLAISTTSYTLTTTDTIATGMSVTFTAVANRLYRISYFEPQAQTASVLSNTTISIRLTNATGTVLNNTIIANTAAATQQNGMICVAYSTFSAGSVTIVGTAKANVTTGTPLLIRDSTRNANIIVEDMGPS